jgi:DNA-binding response OmpR family regulator
MRILVVEDEAELAALTRTALERGGFAVDLARDLALSEEHLAMASYDAVVLDRVLPDGDGLSLLRRLRARRVSVPVLVLTARDGPDDRVAGLDSGADDYLVKPFHMPELLARVRALLRRPGATLGMVLCVGDLALDTASRQVRVGARDIGMTVRETTLLEQLLRHADKVVTRETLEQKLYSFDTQLGSNALEVLVHRLRRKLSEVDAKLAIQTVRGVGYLLTVAPCS